MLMRMLSASALETAAGSTPLQGVTLPLHAHERPGAHLALLRDEDGQLGEVVAGRLADHKRLHRRVANLVHVQRQRAHRRAHLRRKG